MRIRTFIITTLLLITNLHFTKAQKLGHKLSFAIRGTYPQPDNKWESISLSYGGGSIDYGIFYEKKESLNFGLNFSLISRRFEQSGKEDEEYNNIKLLTRLNCFRTKISFNSIPASADFLNVEGGIFFDYIFSKKIRNKGFDKTISLTNLYKDYCWGISIDFIIYPINKRKTKYNLFRPGILVGAENTFNFMKQDYKFSLITYKIGFRLKLNNKTLKRMLR